MLCLHCIYVFCICLRTNSDLCHLQHKLIGFYNRDEKCLQRGTDWVFNPLKPNDAYICRTAPLTSRRCILYIYSTHISTAYFKHAANSPFFPLQNAIYFIKLHCLVPVLFAFYIQSVLKFKCKI